MLGTGRTPRAALEAEGSADLGGGGRFDTEHAQKRRNMPGQFDFGPQRVCWLSQIVTDWMGDDGVLKNLNASIRHPNVVGDTNTVHGEVTKKSVVDGEHLVEVQVRNINQSGLPNGARHRGGGATLAQRRLIKSVESAPAATSASVGGRAWGAGAGQRPAVQEGAGQAAVPAVDFGLSWAATGSRAKKRADSVRWFS